ncbi:MAG: ribosome biogenesis GTPase Der [Pseudomonadota bacterium]
MNPLPLVVIAGRPNVGKSTLFNRIVGGRPALVEDEPGVTRDRRYAEADFAGRSFLVVDAGGLDIVAKAGGLKAAIHRQAWQAVLEANVVVLVVDAREGITPADHDVAELVRSAGRPVVVVANKVDHARIENQSAEAYELGLGTVYGVSAAHGRGIGDLLDELVRILAELDVKVGAAARVEGEGREPEEGEGRTDGPFCPPLEGEGPTEVPSMEGRRRLAAVLDSLDGEGTQPPVDHRAARARSRPSINAAAEQASAALVVRPIRLAFVGRPNVGKSSLVNRILGEERVLVHELPGTTTDPVDTPFEFQDRGYVLVDTAGIRRKPRITTSVERVSVSMALRQIAKSDVAAIVIDALRGPAQQDARIASEVIEASRGALVVINKADLLGSGPQRETAERELRRRLHEEMPFASFAPVLMVSAKTGQGVLQMLEESWRIYEEHGSRVPTAELNRFFAEISSIRPPPSVKGRRVKIFYLTQPATHPPTFLLWASSPGDIDRSYRRFIVNQLRERFGFAGTPIRLVIRAR